LIAHSFFPRSMFDMDSWFRPTSYHAYGPSTLDIFDPFDELDRSICRNLMWLDQPSFMEPLNIKPPRVPKKYRITLDCSGYKSNSIKTEIIDGNRLTIHGSEGGKAAREGEDYSMREFAKTYTLPKNVETDKMVSFLTSNGQLVVEMPLKESEELVQVGGDQGPISLFPRIIDAENGQKRVEAYFNLPENVDPSKVTVMCKDRDLIVKAEKTDEKPDSYSRIYYYQRTTLPENTDFKELKCTYDNNQLLINAPLTQALTDKNRSMPIEFKQQRQEEQQQLKQAQQHQQAPQKEA